MKKLAIIGSGDLGQLIAYHAAADNHFEVKGFFDDYKIKGQKEGEIFVLGGLAEVERMFSKNYFDYLMIGIGYKHFSQRKAIFEKLSLKVPFATIIHSNAFVDRSCSIGQGVLILPGCTLDRNVVISDNVLVNTGSVIAHDSFVGKHSFLSPAVSVAGFVSIGSCCNIGINTTVIDNIKIADNVQTGGGTVVIKDICRNGLFVGNPARFVRDI